VAAKGAIKNYLGYAFRILNKTDHRSLTIRATGNAIVKALILIELVKRRVDELHQLNKIYSMEIVSHEDRIEGMDKIETRRRVTAMDTTLSKDPLDDQDPGYQEPLPKEEQASAPAQKREPKPKAKAGEPKSSHQKGKKLYNALPGKADKEEQEPPSGEKRKEKQRRDNPKANKHEQDKEDVKGPKDKYQQKKDRKKDQEPARGGKDEKKSRKETLKANTIRDDEDRYKRRDQKGGKADFTVRVRLGRRDPKRYNDPPPDRRDDHRGGPPMDRGDFHERDGREFMGPYAYRGSYDDFHVQKGKKGKRRQQEPSYNDDRGNRAPFFMGPHGPGGFYPMPPYGHYPDYYPVGPGYGRDGPRPDRQDDRKGMSMYPDDRRGN
jgi:DNA-binding protein